MLKFDSSLSNSYCSGAGPTGTGQAFDFIWTSGTTDKSGGILRQSIEQ